MKRVIVVRAVLSFCFVLSLLAVSGSGPAFAAETTKIGCITSLTGWSSFLGTAQKEVMETAVNMINASGGANGKKLELIFEDDQSNPTNSAIAATKLIRDKKVNALVAPPHVSGCMSVIPLAEQEQIPTLIPTPATQPLRKWIFHILCDDTLHGPGMFKFFAKDLKAKKIGILVGQEQGFLDGTKGFIEVAKKAGVQIVAREEYKLEDTSVLGQMTRIKAANPDSILFYGIASGATVAAKNYIQLGMNQPVVCSWGVGSTEFAKAMGPLLKDKWVIFGLRFLHGEKLPASDPYHKVYDPFTKAFKAEWHHDAQTYGANAHDAIIAIAEAIKAMKSDSRAAIRDGLEKVRFEGLTGPYHCTSTNHYTMSVDAIVPQSISTGEFLPYRK
jgi:branched-chain amino acid transport system substrate-binding protein